MKVSGKTVKVYLHVWLMNPGIGQVVDHIHHIGTDNRRSNLKVCTPSENGRNTIPDVIFDQGLGLDGCIMHNSRSKGVLFWMSVYFKDIYLGRFADPADAGLIRSIAILVYENATDEQIFEQVPPGHDAEDVQRRIDFVRKTFKMPNPCKLVIAQK